MFPRLHHPDGDHPHPLDTPDDGVPALGHDPYAAYRQPAPSIPLPRSRTTPTRARVAVTRQVSPQASRSPLLLRVTVVTGLVAAAAVSLLRAQSPGSALNGAELALAPRSAPVPAGTSPDVESCRVYHTVTSRSPERFTAVLTVVNTGRAPVRTWTLRWAYPGSGPSSVPRLRDGWKATVTADGTGGQAIDIDPDAEIPAGGSVTIGFVGTGPSADPVSFTLNGVTCR